MNTINTLVELFDECQVENVISALLFQPDKIVFVGFNKTMKKKKREDLRDFFKIKGMNIDVEFEVVGRFDYGFIVEKLEEITNDNPGCVFDLTGGKELVLTAMGEVSAKKNIPMIQVDVSSGKIIHVKNSENIILCGKSDISEEESLILNGGKKIGVSSKVELTDSVKRDISLMWEICRENCGLWNKQSTEFDKIERFFFREQSEFVEVDLQKNKNFEPFIHEEFIKKLSDKGLISGVSLLNDIFKYKFKNSVVRTCLTKAGSILELYAYMLLHEINEEENCFCDIDVGVNVDWDGDAGEKSEGKYETVNEIDIIAMKKHIPVFISCKNGEIQKEALYELATVSEHFGGEYTKKILLASYVSGDESRKKYLLQRARDMKIDVLYDVHKMTKEQFIEELKKRIV